MGKNNANFIYCDSILLGSFAIHKVTKEVTFEGGSKFTRAEWEKIVLICTVIGGEVIKV